SLAMNSAQSEQANSTRKMRSDQAPRRLRRKLSSRRRFIGESFSQGRRASLTRPVGFEPPRDGSSSGRLAARPSSVKGRRDSPAPSRRASKEAGLSSGLAGDGWGKPSSSR